MIDPLEPPAPTEPPVSRRRRADALRLAHGLHLLGGHDADAWQRARAWRSVLADDVAFTGLSAAVLHGWWVPPLPDDVPLFLTRHRDHARVRRAEVRCSRHQGDVATARVGGVRVTTAAHTLLACAADLGVLDVVVLADAALHAGEVTLDDLRRVTGRGRPGSAVLRRALRLSDGRSESAWESLLRVLHVVCDVAVVPQHELHDVHGDFVARGDLWIVGTRTVHEYDGADHRDGVQHRSDLARDRRLAREGVTRHGYTSVEVLRRPVEILRDADAALGRAHDPRRLDAWYRLLRASLFSAPGMASVRRRWRLPTPDTPGPARTWATNHRRAT